MKFIRDILCICVVLHFSPSCYKSVECELIIKPENVVVLSGEVVTLRCASDRITKGSIVWKTTNPGSNSKDIIYLNVLTSSVSSYISVDDSGYGNCNLNINASATAAKRYICTESATAVEASAELIVQENPTMCNVLPIGGNVRVSCSIVSTGNWNPVVECQQRNVDGTTVSVRIQSKRFDNNKVSSTLSFTSKKELNEVICSGKFQQNERPNKTTATNIPEDDFQTVAYRYIYVPPPPSPSPSPTQDAGKALIALIIMPIVFFILLVCAYAVLKKKRCGIIDRCALLLLESSRHQQGYFLIVSQLSGQALEVEGASTNPGALVITSPKHGRDNQLWYDDLETGTIRTKINNFCFDVELNGQLVVKPFQQGDQNQQWERRGKLIANRNNKNEVLEIVGSDKNQGAKVAKNQFNGGQSQFWTFE